MELAERKASDMQLLFNVNEYLKLAAMVTCYIQVYQETSVIESLLKTEMGDSTAGLTPEQLKQIEQHTEDDKKKRQTLKDKW